MFAPDKILVPTDFSEDGIHCSRVGTQQAITIADGSGAEAGRDLKVSLKIRDGTPYSEILHEADASEVDLVSNATQGLNPAEDFFCGSTTERVVRRATCNVLVVRD